MEWTTHATPELDGRGMQLAPSCKSIIWRKCRESDPLKNVPLIFSDEMANLTPAMKADTAHCTPQTDHVLRIQYEMAYQPP